ncbi:MAG: MBL fold metallo-hydrolase [Burkholderiaceae bacterium]
MLEFVALGSGSEGNGTVVRAGVPGSQTSVLLDCGFGLRDCVARLAAVGLEPADLSGILVTHEHSDHVGGAYKFARRFGIPLYASHGTFSATRGDADGVDMQVVCSHTAFAIGALQMMPFPVPHDAREPTQFTFTDGTRKLGVLTDIGCGTPHVTKVLSGCDALVLECNHDAQMLEQSAYPAMLKARIRGNFGHLSNDAAAAILAGLDNSRLRSVHGAHLSRQNNAPQLARAALASALGTSAEDVGILEQDAPGQWVGV